jgi:hypothetical protein
VPLLAGLGRLGTPARAQAVATANPCRMGQVAQPATVPFNDGGYVFGAVVKHPVLVT